MNAFIKIPDTNMFFVYSFSIAAGIFLVAYGVLHRPGNGQRAQECCTQTVSDDLSAPDDEQITLRFSDEAPGESMSSFSDSASTAHKTERKIFSWQASWASIAKRLKSLKGRQRLDKPVVKGVVLNPKISKEAPKPADSSN